MPWRRALPGPTGLRPGRCGPAQCGRVLDQQTGAGGLKLPGNDRAVGDLQHIGGGLRVAQQPVSGFAGRGLPRAQARDARPGLPCPARRQRHHPPGVADVALPRPTKMRL